MKRGVAVCDAVHRGLSEDKSGEDMTPRVGGAVRTGLQDPALSEAMKEIQEEGRLSDGDILTMRTRRRRRLAGGGAMVLLCATVFGGLQTGWFLSPPATFEHYETGRGEQLRITLSDGTHIHLNGSTRLDVRLGAKQRFVEMQHGEAFFDVAHNAQRPFIVHAGASDTRVLGTAFGIDMSRAAVRLAVYRGKVRFGEDGRKDHNVLVAAGWRSRLDGGLLATPTRFDTMQQDWREDWIDTDDMRLVDLVDTLNRRSGPSVLDPSPALGRLRLSGRFKLDDPKQLLSAMGSAYGFAVIDRGNQLELVADQSVATDP